MKTQRISLTFVDEKQQALIGVKLREQIDRDPLFEFESHDEGARTIYVRGPESSTARLLLDVKARTLVSFEVHGPVMGAAHPIDDRLAPKIELLG